jgi:hypothetical protein
MDLFPGEEMVSVRLRLLTIVTELKQIMKRMAVT